MANDPSTYIPVVVLSPAELARFRKNAPAALAARDAGFVAEQFACSGELVLIGTLPLVGVLAYDWSAPSLVVFLLVGIWTAIVCDVAKYTAMRSVATSEARAFEDHRRVWLVVHALRKQQKEARAIIAKYPPGVGLFIDIAMGSGATVFLTMGVLESEPQCVRLAFQDMDFALSLLSLIGYESALTIWIVLHHRLGGGRNRAVRIDAGMRGPGLLALLAIAVSIGDLTGTPPSEGRLSASVMMLVANGWFVVLGMLSAVNTVFAIQETAWLRAYLRLGHGWSKRRAR